MILGCVGFFLDFMFVCFDRFRFTFVFLIIAYLVLPCLVSLLFLWVHFFELSFLVYSRVLLFVLLRFVLFSVIFFIYTVPESRLFSSVYALPRSSSPFTAVFYLLISFWLVRLAPLSLPHTRPQYLSSLISFLLLFSNVSITLSFLIWFLPESFLL